MRPVIVIVFAVFTAYSVAVAYGHGLLGWLTLAGDEPWAMQMLLDLVIALFLVSSGILRDARERGTRAWPWLLGTALLGSIAPLAYLAFRRPSRSSSARA